MVIETHEQAVEALKALRDYVDRDPDEVQQSAPNHTTRARGTIMVTTNPDGFIAASVTTSIHGVAATMAELRGDARGIAEALLEMTKERASGGNAL